MSNAVELITIVGLSIVTVAGVRYLKRVQPDPNPAIEAREAAAVAASLTALPEGDRRVNPLPFVGREQREQPATEAVAARRSA